VPRYIDDGFTLLAEVDGGNTARARYWHGPRVDQVVAAERGGARVAYFGDHLGSVRQAVDTTNGVTLFKTDYDAYGGLRGTSGTSQGPFGFVGRERDSESGLYYYRLRYYDPETGRFLTPDPMGFAAGDTNLYRYVFNNPTNLTDPYGLVSPEFCRRTLERIRNIQSKINERLRELREDPLGLPKSCPGDQEKPSLSREGHQRLINMDKANLAVQQALYLAFCGDPPNGTPARDESFFDWKYWERVTGLTGAALLAYLIISEGSRAFPPRNLLPIP
jgi:RHS repeat-associated protein